MSLLLDRWIDERQAAEVLWRGHLIHSKSWLVEAIESWMKSLTSDPVLSKDPLLPAYGQVGIITFAVQAIEDLACVGHAYLKAQEEGVERIHETVRDFGDSKVDGAGTVYDFFNSILTSDQATEKLLGPGFAPSRAHLQSVYEFYNKYRKLYLKFKHGQGFVVTESRDGPAVYIIPDKIDRKNGQVKLPRSDCFVLLDEWKKASEIVRRINGYFLQIRARSIEFFPSWKQEYENGLKELVQAQESISSAPAKT